MDQWRVTVLGDGGVGKTALAVQTYDPTIEDAYRKQMIVDQKLCFIEVIDTAGQEEYSTLRDQWVREGQGFVLVYSIASRATFDRLEVFRQNMVRVKRSHPIFVLVGNKCDKTYEREVSREEGAALARHFGCDFLETSAKTAANVDRLFTDLVRSLRQNKEAQENGGRDPGLGGGGPHGIPGGRSKKVKSSKCVIV
ncbi:Ras GTPase ras2 [Serendipita sp. 411]|nr:Ras GTPase ras2 [Serendipita sp. 411]KAG9056171.1 Ras GTPase ras2 [Serendipita sp. 407]